MLDLPVVTPAAPGERAASIAFAHSRDEELVRRAAQAGILLWDGNARVRASVHLFNTEEDIRRYAEWLAGAGLDL